MSTPVITPRTAAPRRQNERRAGSGQALHAEWTKFRTVHGWVNGMIIAALVTVGIALLDHSSCSGVVTPGSPAITGQGCSAPLGPGREAVSDSFYFVHRTLSDGGSITARLTSLTAPANVHAHLQPWSKAGIIIKASIKPGSPYTAMMVTPGHGVRMQYDYTGDIAGLPGTARQASPCCAATRRSPSPWPSSHSAGGRRERRHAHPGDEGPPGVSPGQSMRAALHAEWTKLRTLAVQNGK